MKQQSLFKEKIDLTFGGSKLKGKRKSRRTLDSKRPIHLVLKATNDEQLLLNRQKVTATLKRMADKFHIKIYSAAVNADHIHLVIKIPCRLMYTRWIRAFTGLLAKTIPGVKWGLRPYSRIVSWGRAFKSLLSYVQINRVEADRIVTLHEKLDRARDLLFRELEQKYEVISLRSLYSAA